MNLSFNLTPTPLSDESQVEDRWQLLKLLRTWAKLQLISVLVWEAEALLVATQQAHLDEIVVGKHTPVWRLFEVTSANYIVAAVLVPFVVGLAVLGDFGEGRRLKSVAIHVAGFVSFVAAHAVLRAYVLATHNPLTGAEIETQKMVWGLFLYFLNDDIFVYVPTVILTVGYRYYRELRERDLVNERMKSELALAQLQILKMQLRPHFLFNTLHAISTLTNKDPRRAKKMISLLSDLLRIAIDYGTTQEVPLKEEIDFVGKYLDIERVRFEESLETRLEIPTNTLDALVPNLLLQPLVENAVKHGVCALEGVGCVTIRAECRDGSLFLFVSDNGPGIPSNPGKGESGIGLKLTRTRLERMYGDNQWVAIENLPEKGARISIRIPFHTRPIAHN
jgi:signal transduction histidine kinase